MSDETAKQIAESCTVEVTDEDGVVIAFATLATLAAVAMAIIITTSIITTTITTMTITAKSNSSNSSTIMMEST